MASYEYDVVLQNGRIIDPETERDAAGSVGIVGGEIKAVTATGDAPLRGKHVVDCTGLVIAPGFIDMHRYPRSAHMQNCSCHGPTSRGHSWQDKVIKTYES